MIVTFINKHKRKLLILAGVLLALILSISSLMSPKLSPKILTVSPKNGNSGVSPNVQLKIVFTSKINEKNVDKIEVKVFPNLNHTKMWVKADTLIVRPAEPLLLDTKYTVSIFYNQKPIGSYAFSTKSGPQLTVTEKAVVEQADDDKVFNEETAQILASLPWYTKLPIDTSEYRVVYDFVKKSFRIRLKVYSDAPNEKIEELKEKALRDLIKVGANPQKETYYVLFLK